MNNFWWKQAFVCAAVLAVTPALAQAQRTDPAAPPLPKAKAAGTAQIYNVSADVNVATSTTLLDVVVCNTSDTLGKGTIRKDDGMGKEGFAVPARECAIVKGTYLLDLDIKDTPAPWKAIVWTSPASK